METILVSWTLIGFLHNQVEARVSEFAYESALSISPSHSLDGREADFGIVYAPEIFILAPQLGVW